MSSCSNLCAVRESFVEFSCSSAVIGAAIGAPTVLGRDPHMHCLNALRRLVSLCCLAACVAASDEACEAPMTLSSFAHALNEKFIECLCTRSREGESAPQDSRLSVLCRESTWSTWSAVSNRTIPGG